MCSPVVTFWAERRVTCASSRSSCAALAMRYRDHRSTRHFHRPAPPGRDPLVGGEELGPSAQATPRCGGSVALWCALRELKPDLVCAQPPRPARWHGQRRACTTSPVSLLRTDGPFSIAARCAPNPLFCWAERLAGRLGRRVINVCEYERVLAQRLGLPGKALEVVHNGIAESSLPAGGQSMPSRRCW